jgi:uncharacterized repeat protein (TIGR01451 family)
VKAAPPGEPSLALAKVASPEPVLVGERLTYTIIVTNTGQAPLSDFAIRDQVPVGTSFVSAGYLDGRWMYSGPVEGGRGEVVWLAENPLPPGEASRLLLVVKVEPGITGFVVNDEYAALTLPDGSLLIQGMPVRTGVIVPAVTPTKPAPAPTATPSPIATPLPPHLGATPTPARDLQPAASATVTPAAGAEGEKGTRTSAWCPLAGVALIFSIALWWVRGQV